MNIFIKKIWIRSETYVLVIGIIFALSVQLISGQFFTNTGIINLCRASMIYLVFGLVEMLSLICAGPDVSFPAIASLSSFVTVVVFNKLNYEGSMIWVFLFAIAVGGVCGAVNGFVMAKYNFPSLIVTLGTSSLFSGIMFGPLKASNTPICASMISFGRIQLISCANPVTGLNAILPGAFALVIVLYVLIFLLLRYTVFGRGLYALGADIVSAEREGFNVKKIRFGTFCLCGSLAAVGGILYSCNVSACSPTDLMGGEMVIIAACILGGVRPGQGIGNIFNVLIGIVLITMIENNLLLLGIPLYWQNAFTGAIILAGTVVSVSTMRKRGGQLLL